jgi:hypothetical protein
MSPMISNGKSGSTRLHAVAVLGLVATLTAQLVLSIVIKGASYGEMDGEAAQAAILTAFRFVGILDVSNINPLQGIGSQLFPLNVWVNPAHWPFAFLDRHLATDISAVIALACLMLACFLMARSFDLPVLPSMIAAQLCILLFAPSLRYFRLSVVFGAIPGIAVVYAPYMIALGVLARLEPGSRRDFVLSTSAIVMLIFFSIYCDPLWTMVCAISWITPFAVVTFGPLQLRTIIIRCAALLCCAVLLWISGALEYLFTLSQYTARVQFPEVLGRPHAPEFTSVIFNAPLAKYLYGVSLLGWLLGLWLQRGRARLLVIAASVSWGVFLIYGACFLLSEGRWWLPLPIYMEHALWPLFATAAIAGYSCVARKGWLSSPVARRSLVASAWTTIFVAVALASSTFVMAWRGAARTGTPISETFNHPGPNELEFSDFVAEKIGLAGDRRFRGSIALWAYGQDDAFTMEKLVIRAVPWADEYSQMVSPQAIYFNHQLFKKDIGSDLNYFWPWIGATGSYEVLFRTFQVMGLRYMAGYGPFPEAEAARFPSVAFPRRPTAAESGIWHVYELPRPNVGDYSPTELVTADSGAEMLEFMRRSDFDFARKAVVGSQGANLGPLVPAHDMQLTVIRGGLQVAGRSDGMSFVVLPQQFSHCLKPRDPHVRLIRADFLLTGMIFSNSVNTDIRFDYGIFSPACRRLDLADVKALGMTISQASAQAPITSVVLDWQRLRRKIRAIGASIK